MKDCVVFGSYIPDQGSLNGIGKVFLDLFNVHFKDDDIYIGINPCALINQWTDAIKSYKNLNIKYAVTDSHMDIKSDASSYQTALRRMYQDKNEYRYVWFFHTEGTNSKDSICRNTHINALINKKSKVISGLEMDDRIGMFTHRLYQYGSQDPSQKITTTNIAFELDKYFEFKYTPLEYFAWGSMYVIKGHIVTSFLYNVSNEFLKKAVYTCQSTKGKLVGDPYFFERDFQHICERQGYLPLFGQMFGYPHGARFSFDSKAHFHTELKLWHERNNIPYDAQLSKKIISFSSTI